MLGEEKKEDVWHQQKGSAAPRTPVFEPKGGSSLVEKAKEGGTSRILAAPPLETGQRAGHAESETTTFLESKTE